MPGSPIGLAVRDFLQDLLVVERFERDEAGPRSEKVRLIAIGLSRVHHQTRIRLMLASRSYDRMTVDVRDLEVRDDCREAFARKGIYRVRSAAERRDLVSLRTNSKWRPGSPARSSLRRHGSRTSSC
jgi:hypothetical protein